MGHPVFPVLHPLCTGYFSQLKIMLPRVTASPYQPNSPNTQLSLQWLQDSVYAGRQLSRFSKFIFSVLFLNNYTRDTPFNYLSSEARHFFGGDGKPTFGLVTILTTWSHLVVIPVNSLSHLATAGHTWQQLLTSGTIWSHLIYLLILIFYDWNEEEKKKREDFTTGKNGWIWRTKWLQCSKN